jgi:hypothetical protein
MSIHVCPCKEASSESKLLLQLPIEWYTVRHLVKCLPIRSCLRAYHVKFLAMSQPCAVKVGQSAEDTLDDGPPDGPADSLEKVRSWVRADATTDIGPNSEPSAGRSYRANTRLLNVPVKYLAILLACKSSKFSRVSP